MTEEEKIEAYRIQLKQIGENIANLANFDTQIKRLTYAKNLDPLEQSIRDFIERFSE